MNLLQSSDAFESRARGFEEGYYRTKDAELVDKLRAVFQAKHTKDELRKATGITNEEVLDRLVDLNLRGEALIAFKLYPLVEIAWANGKPTKREVESVIDSAVRAGVPRDSALIHRMEEWLHRGPTADARAAWRMYAGELRKMLTPAELAGFRKDLLKYATDVAHTCGGFLGIFYLPVTQTQHRILDEITKALSHEGH